MPLIPLLRSLLSRNRLPRITLLRGKWYRIHLLRKRLSRGSLFRSGGGTQGIKPGTVVTVLVAAAAVAWLLTYPRDLFEDTPYSTVVLDRNGELLGARIAADGQWRFPPSLSVPDKYAAALVEFEDRHFYLHRGVDPSAVLRALIQNLRAGRVVSGGSTLTMQLMRLSHGGERTLPRKLWEAFQALRFEWTHSKKSVMALYASHAPFGGNVVGIDAAAWRYFAHSAEELSWGEAATLAILPNSPSSIHLSRSREKLLHKRNRLLKRLYDRGKMDRTDYELACAEPLPEEPQALPQHAPHLVDAYVRDFSGQSIRTDLDLPLQLRVSAVVDRWNHALRISGVNDLAAVVFDVHSGKAVAYTGNANASDGRPGAQVDILRSPRSTGSILKPFLYCAMLQDGHMLPHTLLPDVPVNINGFSPQNFDLSYSGAVPASEALARSLNIPSVHMLREYGVPRFYELLKKSGMTSLTRDASDYGLSLILGGAEGKLYEITSIYAEMSAWYQDVTDDDRFRDFPFSDRTAAYWTFEALSEVNRPDEMDWHLISSVRKVAWKTGTSFGFRDAWAVGVTPDYAVGVWAGNAQGQGSPGLVGARTAGPVLFDIFNLLPQSDWFGKPYPGDYVEAEVCRKSGCLKGLGCEECDTLMLPLKALRTEVCPYHRSVTLSSDDRWRVDPSVPGAHTVTMFLLPPSMEWYYRSRHPDYVPLPPLLTSGGSELYSPMEFIHPEPGSVLSIPRQLDGSLKGLVFSLAHSTPEVEVYWHLDDDYVGSTRYFHQMRLLPSEGKHTLTVVDADGCSLSVAFTIQSEKL